ncbi:hypothetical protein BaRGS_00026434 [Batillaria attramentaria]|uniref:Uncharacterized protein n=1 Tax=Batillaria attramentaria TaxID=370345 RepID=A0ABD0K5U6_9CAEN
MKQSFRQKQPQQMFQCRSNLDVYVCVVGVSFSGPSTQAFTQDSGLGGVSENQYEIRTALSFVRRVLCPVLRTAVQLSDHGILGPGDNTLCRGQKREDQRTTSRSRGTADHKESAQVSTDNILRLSHERRNDVDNGMYTRGTALYLI